MNSRLNQSPTSSPSQSTVILPPPRPGAFPAPILSPVVPSHRLRVCFFSPFVSRKLKRPAGAVTAAFVFNHGLMRPGGHVPHPECGMCSRRRLHPFYSAPSTMSGRCTGPFSRLLPPITHKVHFNVKIALKIPNLTRELHRHALSCSCNDY